jgi:acetylornithine deacetylase/succinyl-diaminopimelate desuccinylase-like protein
LLIPPSKNPEPPHPAGDGAGWTHDPWGGELVDGRIYGRGACDMKCGTTASIFTFLYLHAVAIATGRNRRFRR